MPVTKGVVTVSLQLYILCVCGSVMECNELSIIWHASEEECSLSRAKQTTVSQWEDATSCSDCSANLLLWGEAMMIVATSCHPLPSYSIVKCLTHDKGHKACIVIIWCRLQYCHSLYAHAVTQLRLCLVHVTAGVCLLWKASHREWVSGDWDGWSSRKPNAIRITVWMGWFRTRCDWASRRWECAWTEAKAGWYWTYFVTVHRNTLQSAPWSCLMMHAY